MPAKKFPSKVLSHVVINNVIGATGEADAFLRGTPEIKSVFDLSEQSAFGIASLSDEEDSSMSAAAVKWTKVSGENSTMVMLPGEKFLGVVSIDDPLAIARVPYMITAIFK